MVGVSCYSVEEVKFVFDCKHRQMAKSEIVDLCKKKWPRKEWKVTKISYILGKYKEDERYKQRDDDTRQPWDPPSFNRALSQSKTARRAPARAQVSRAKPRITLNNQSNSRAASPPIRKPPTRQQKPAPHTSPISSRLPSNQYAQQMRNISGGPMEATFTSAQPMNLLNSPVHAELTLLDHAKEANNLGIGAIERGAEVSLSASPKSHGNGSSRQEDWNETNAAQNTAVAFGWGGFQTGRSPQPGIRATATNVSSMLGQHSGYGSVNTREIAYPNSMQSYGNNNSQNRTVQFENLYAPYQSHTLTAPFGRGASENQGSMQDDYRHAGNRSMQQGLTYKKGESGDWHGPAYNTDYQTWEDMSRASSQRSEFRTATENPPTADRNNSTYAEARQHYSRGLIPRNTPNFILDAKLAKMRHETLSRSNSNVNMVADNLANQSMRQDSAGQFNPYANGFPGTTLMDNVGENVDASTTHEILNIVSVSDSDFHALTDTRKSGQLFQPSQQPLNGFDNVGHIPSKVPSSGEGNREIQSGDKGCHVMDLYNSRSMERFTLPFLDWKLADNQTTSPIDSIGENWVANSDLILSNGSDTIDLLDFFNFSDSNAPSSSSSTVNLHKRENLSGLRSPALTLKRSCVEKAVLNNHLPGQVSEKTHPLPEVIDNSYFNDNMNMDWSTDGNGLGYWQPSIEGIGNESLSLVSNTISTPPSVTSSQSSSRDSIGPPHRPAHSLSNNKTSQFSARSGISQLSPQLLDSYKKQTPGSTVKRGSHQSDTAQGVALGHQAVPGQQADSKLQQAPKEKDSESNTQAKEPIYSFSPDHSFFKSGEPPADWFQAARESSARETEEREQAAREKATRIEAAKKKVAREETAKSEEMPNQQEQGDSVSSQSATATTHLAFLQTAKLDDTAAIPNTQLTPQPYISPSTQQQVEATALRVLPTSTSLAQSTEQGELEAQPAVTVKAPPTPSQNVYPPFLCRSKCQYSQMLLDHQFEQLKATVPNVGPYTVVNCFFIAEAAERGKKLGYDPPVTPVQMQLFASDVQRDIHGKPVTWEPNWGAKAFLAESRLVGFLEAGEERLFKEEDPHFGVSWDDGDDEYGPKGTYETMNGKLTHEEQEYKEVDGKMKQVDIYRYNVQP